MKPYRDLDAAYQLIRRRHARRPIPGLGDLDHIVDAIRADAPDPATSDEALRHLLSVGTVHPDANTVALHALAPALSYRISRVATVEHHHNGLVELTLVLLNSDLAGARLAHRLVNRAHTRIWKAAKTARTRGGENPIEILPGEPDRLALVGDLLADGRLDEVGDQVVDRISLQRFEAAVEAAVSSGVIPMHAWAAYRNTRLLRAVVAGLPPTTSQERVLAHRAARRLAPYVDAHLSVHAA